MHRFKTLSALTATWLLAACSSDTAKDHSIASIELRPRSVTVDVGESETLTVVAKDAEGDVVDDAVFTWKSSDGDIVEVEDGVVTGLAMGKAEVTASADGETSNAALVDVVEEAKPPLERFDIELSTNKLPVLQGTSESLTVKLIRSEGFTDDVTLKEVGLPQGTTANEFTFSGDTLETTITVKAAATAPFTLPTNVQFEATAGDITETEALTVTVYGKPGVVDTTFGGGSVVVPVGASDDYAYATAVQKDGKVLVAGRSAENLGDFALVRLDRDGTLDETFGTGGKVTTKIGERDETAYAIAIQEDGKIVLAGATTSDTTGKDFAVVRYETDGKLDGGFGDGGKVVIPFSDDADTGYAIAIQQDRKIVVGGDANGGTSVSGLDFALARLEPDGTLDEGFGEGGKVMQPIGEGSGRDSVYALALHQIGGETRIVAAGGEGDFQLARFRANGGLDATFGEAGKITRVNGSTIGAARAVTIAKDGKVVVAGHSHHDFAVARFDQSGHLDDAFGEAGKTITKVSESNWDEAHGVAIEESGKIVVGGWVYQGQSSAGNFALVRYDDEGVLDPTFGEEGVVITDTRGKSKADEGYAVLLQSDERVPIVRVIVAGAGNDSNSDFVVTRYFR